MSTEGRALENDDMLPEYEFSGGVRGKHYIAYRKGHAVQAHKADTTEGLESAEDDTRWDTLLATEASQRLLEKLADEALAEVEAGQARLMVLIEDGEIAPGQDPTFC